MCPALQKEGGYERKIYKDDISVVCNAQFVLKLDNFASPKCYFLMQSMSVQAALAFKANSVFPAVGITLPILMNLTKLAHKTSFFSLVRMT